MNEKILITTSEIAYNFGGLTKAMLNRCKVFSKQFGVKTQIATFNFDPEYPQIIRSLYQRKYIDNNTTVTNINEFFKERCSSSLVNSKVDIDSVGYSPSTEYQFLQEVKESSTISRFYLNGLYKMYRRKNINGSTILEDYFDERRSRIKRKIYNSESILTKILIFDSVYNKLVQELFLTEEGICYLSKWHEYNPSNETSKIIRIMLFDYVNNKSIEFRNTIDFQHFFLEKLVGEKSTFLIGEARGTDDMTLSFNSPFIYKIYMTHSTHLREPYHFMSTIRLGNRAVLSRLNEVDAIVFLTNLQRDDIKSRYGSRENYFVIPHYSEHILDKPVIPMDHNVTILSRYHKEKRLDIAIKAFEEVVSALPDASLSIYGFGEEKENLEKLIRELGLTRNVFLKPYTENPKQTLENSSISLITSKYEGFAMSVLESLSNGTPVISMDIKYGPSDMIRSGYNGYLIEGDNIKEMSDRIIELLSTKDRLNQFSKNAIESSHHFSEKKFADNWKEMFETIKSQKAMKINVENMDLYLSSVTLERSNLSFEGNVYFLNVKDSEVLSPNIIGKLYDRETKNFIEFPLKVIKISNDNYYIEAHLKIDHFNIKKQCILDISILSEDRNVAFEKRLGYNKAENIIMSTKTINSNFLAVPYFTKDHGNLSIKIENNSQ
ncbi:glycosyltransferase [Alkalicoccobacillus plakortidis]|uniref:Glycosyltransferase n=1 Tax=Alkalicoccobacillus plakortidis TaxID=444060 RepID=A0ABT0XK50_9BACI|nr:glycosyltransferase [Alkalicoccobacillus plakortidis]MCM2675748.1 glycosyltransferase [Alkalicoccobacillus plakortidis]